MAAPMTTQLTRNHFFYIRLIYLKELREIFRDKRTRFSVIVSPLLITPLLMGLMGSVIGNVVRQEKVDIYSVGVVNASASPTIAKLLQSNNTIKVIDVTQAEAEKQIRDHKMRSAIVIPPNAESLVHDNRTVHITTLFDEGNDTSTSALGRLKQIFSSAAQKLVAVRLTENHLSPELSLPYDVKGTPISAGGSAATMMMAMMLPYVLAISAIGAGVYAANDLVAGEKERGTLETLLVSPASRRDLVLGKFFAVATVCLIGSILAVMGMLIPFYLPIKAFAWIARGGGASLSLLSGIAILLVQIPLAVLFAGLLLGISTFARNQKEAQTYLGPVMLMVIVPAMMSMLLKAEAPWTMALIPVLNATLVLKQALSGIFNPTFVAVATLSSAFYAGIAVTFATKLFQKESVLLKA
ncbi:MAG: ABC transporter permease [Chthonomonadales bacterium]